MYEARVAYTVKRKWYNVSHKFIVFPQQTDPFCPTLRPRPWVTTDKPCAICLIYPEGARPLILLECTVHSSKVSVPPPVWQTPPHSIGFSDPLVHGHPAPAPQVLNLSADNGTTFLLPAHVQKQRSFSSCHTTHVIKKTIGCQSLLPNSH